MKPVQKWRKLRFFFGIVATTILVSCQNDAKPSMQLPLATDTVFAVQHSNAIRLVDGVKSWKAAHPGEGFSRSIIDSLARQSVFAGYHYQLPDSTYYIINYVKADFFEVLYCPERMDNEMKMPYFLATPASVYVLDY